MSDAVEQMREQCAQVADDLERRWRTSAAKHREAYKRCWIGGHDLLRSARVFEAAADGLKAVASVIRELPTEPPPLSPQCRRLG